MTLVDPHGRRVDDLRLSVTGHILFCLRRPLLLEPVLAFYGGLNPVQLPQSTVSRHLSLLKNAGWLSDRRAGVWIHYSLAKDLSPIHTTLVAALRAILIQNKSAGKDRERLSKLSRKTGRLS